MTKDRVLQVLVAFCEATTAHGILRLVHGVTWRRFCWFVLVIGAFIGFWIHTGFLIARFISNPANTEIYESGAKFVFPDVTLCPTSHYSEGGSTRVVRPQNSAFSNYSINTLETILQRVKQVLSKVRNASQNMESVSRLALRHFVNQRKEDLLKWPKDHLIFCNYRGRTCHFDNFTVYFHPTKFLCFTFQPRNRTLGSPGENSGLELILFAGYDFQFATVAEQFRYVRGYQIVVHPPNTRPNFLAAGLKAQTGHVTNIEVDMTNNFQLARPNANCHSETKTVSFLGGDYTGHSHGHDVDNDTFLYTVEDCRIAQHQRVMIESCGCYDDRKPLPLEIFRAQQHPHACNTLHDENGVFNWQKNEVGPNIAFHKPVWLSRYLDEYEYFLHDNGKYYIYYYYSYAVDGKRNGYPASNIFEGLYLCTLIFAVRNQPTWLAVHIGYEASIDFVRLYPWSYRTFGPSYLRYFDVLVGSGDTDWMNNSLAQTAFLNYDLCGSRTATESAEFYDIHCHGLIGKFVVVRTIYDIPMAICELEIYPTVQELFKGNESSYVGVQSATISGQSCMDWSSDANTLHPTNNSANAFLRKNFCRYPGPPPASANVSSSIWCFVNNTERANVTWEQCEPEEIVSEEVNTSYVDAHLTCYENALSRMEKMAEPDKKCIPLCRQSIYRTSVDKKEWPTDPLYTRPKLYQYFDATKLYCQKHNQTFLENLEMYDLFSDEGITKNLAVLRVYARTINGLQLQQRWAYTSSRFFSDFGGTLGLWVGISSITVCELMELLLNLLTIFLTKVKVRSNEEKEEQEEEDEPVEEPVIKSSVINQVTDFNPDFSTQFAELEQFSLPSQCQKDGH